MGAEVQPARPEPKVASELARGPLKDEVDPPGDAVVREAPLCGGPHQAVPDPTEVLQSHFVFGILEVVRELRRPSLHLVLKVGPLLGDGPELRLGEVPAAFEVLSTARRCRGYLERLPDSPSDDQGYTQVSLARLGRTIGIWYDRQNTEQSSSKMCSSSSMVLDAKEIDVSVASRACKIEAFPPALQSPALRCAANDLRPFSPPTPGPSLPSHGARCRPSRLAVGYRLRGSNRWRFSAGGEGLNRS